MQLRRTLAALSLTAVVALAGCSGAGGGSDESGAKSGDSGSSASDQGGQQQPTAGGADQQQQPKKPDTSDIPEVVATVDGEKITKKEFVAVYEPQVQQAQMQQQQQQGAQAPDEKTMKKQVVDQLVGNRLLLDAAHEAGYKASDKDVDSTLDDIAKQNGLQSGDEVVQTLEKQGQSEKSIRDDAAAQFAINGYLDKKVGVKKPSDKELHKQYDEVKKQSEGQGGQQAQGGQQSQVPPFEDVKDQLADQAITQQRNEGASKVVKELRQDADVKINL